MVGRVGQRKGWVSSLLRTHPVGHMATSPAQMYKVAFVCCLEGGLDRGYHGKTPEDLRPKPNLPQGHPAL